MRTRRLSIAMMKSEREEKKVFQKLRREKIKTRQRKQSQASRHHSWTSWKKLNRSVLIGSWESILSGPPIIIINPDGKVAL